MVSSCYTCWRHLETKKKKKLVSGCCKLQQPETSMGYGCYPCVVARNQIFLMVSSCCTCQQHPKTNKFWFLDATSCSSPKPFMVFQLLPMCNTQKPNYFNGFWLLPQQQLGTLHKQNKHNDRTKKKLVSLFSNVIT